MPILDLERGVIVLRIVYDGPPLAGKTTSVRALARSLGRTSFSGAEAEGRTLQFDWLDYVGGRFEGYPIRCQILAVPGQEALGARRRRILRSADSVIFVADSRQERLEASLLSLRELRRFLDGCGEPQPAIVFQANHRDAASSVALSRIRSRLSVGPTMPVAETVASDGVGIRETFVLSVRLALDLARDLMSRGLLERGTPEHDAPTELLRDLREIEGSPEWTASTPEEAASRGDLEASSLGNESSVCGGGPRAGSEATSVPLTPDTTVPSGFVWPPIEGRSILHEAAVSRDHVRSAGPNAWAFATDSWTGLSLDTMVFEDLDAGRSALVDWARVHTALGGMISGRRCIVLCPTGTGSWRVWSIVGTLPSIAHSLTDALGHSDATVAAAVLLSAARALAEHREAFRTVGLEADADSLGLVGDRVQYLRVLPYPEPIPLADDDRDPPSAVRADLRSVVRRALRRQPESAVALLDRLGAHATTAAGRKWIETLQAILIED